jgi:hypothetical protein
VPASNQQRRTTAWAGAFLALCALFGPGPSWSQEPAPNREYQIKAAFLFNFTRFVDWPPSAFTDERSPFSICVIGADPFGGDLDEIVRGETAHGRSLVVIRPGRVEELPACHIVYVSRSEAPRLAAIRAALNGKPVLSVSDAGEFIASGGIVRFDTASGKIRLSINHDAAKRAGLTLSSKLLRSADIVSGG